ncbi:MAG: hypothetical protein ACOYMG_20370, partial [Candidatus Methylumidiphilus sp.]
GVLLENGHLEQECFKDGQKPHWLAWHEPLYTGKNATGKTEKKQVNSLQITIGQRTISQQHRHRDAYENCRRVKLD